MRRVDIVCAESSGSTEPTGTSGGIDSLAEGCVKGTCVVSCFFARTFRRQLSQVDLVAPSQVPDVMLHQVVVARKNNHCLDLVCNVGPNQ